MQEQQQQQQQLKNKYCYSSSLYFATAKFQVCIAYMHMIAVWLHFIFFV